MLRRFDSAGQVYPHRSIYGLLNSGADSKGTHPVNPHHVVQFHRILHVGASPQTLLHHTPKTISFSLELGEKAAFQAAMILFLKYLA